MSLHTPQEDMAISCENVSKTYWLVDQASYWQLMFGKKLDASKSYQALDNLTLNVPKGKFLGILGRNGAGKSTLLRTLGGVYAPDKGVVKVNGGLAGLFEMGGLGNRHITGRAYARRTLEIYGAKGKVLERLIKDVEAFSELGKRFNDFIFTYSSGMAARLYFATATAMQHEIYLVDEILAVGDEHFQAKCWKRLRERFAQGASGILVTHDWSATLKLCENAYIMDKGHFIDYGPSDKMVQKYLSLPVPSKKVAAISESNPTAYQVKSGVDTTFRFEIEIFENTPVTFNYTIEQLRIGIGWDILLLNESYIDLTDKPGVYTVNLNIPKLPLSAGKYYLNIFLGSKDPRVNNLDLDARSWTYGNGYELIVEGVGSATAVKLPWEWQASERAHA